MSAPHAVQGEAPVVSAAWVAMDAVWAAERCREAIYNAMRIANERGVVLPGWPLLLEVDAQLQRLVDPDGVVRSIAENELRGAGESVSKFTDAEMARIREAAALDPAEALEALRVQFRRIYRLHEACQVADAIRDAANGDTP